MNDGTRFEPPDRAHIREEVRRALDEDIGDGDVTAKAWINRRSNWNPHFLNPDEFYINFWGSFSPV